MWAYVQLISIGEYDKKEFIVAGGLYSWRNIFCEPNYVAGEFAKYSCVNYYI